MLSMPLSLKSRKHKKITNTSFLLLILLTFNPQSLWCFGEANSRHDWRWWAFWKVPAKAKVHQRQPSGWRSNGWQEVSCSEVLVVRMLREVFQSYPSSSTKANGYSDLGVRDKQGLIENEMVSASQNQFSLVALREAFKWDLLRQRAEHILFNWRTNAPKQ